MLHRQSEPPAPRIGIDLLGSDTPPHQLLEAVLHLLSQEASPGELTLFGTQDLFENFHIPDTVKTRSVSEVITIDDDPLTAVRRKKDSSICTAIQMLRHFELDAFVTAGNTGAVIASAALSLPLLKGIDHPALLALMPTKKQPVAVLDVGATVHAKAEMLHQFALMGIAYQKARGIPRPVVGLLNIGAEKQKGTPELRKAYELLQSLNQDAPLSSPLFVGNIEGRDVFHGDIDVLITDGFTGNVFLKTSEGIASFILEQLAHFVETERDPFMDGLLVNLRQRLHYAEYPGAILCGVDGIVVKCHGASSPKALINSIKGASRLVAHSFLEKIKIELNAQS